MKITKKEALNQLKTFDGAISHPEFGIFKKHKAAGKEFMEWYNKHYKDFFDKLTEGIK